MGTNTLDARTNGQTIDETWFNIIRSISIADYVPRDATGAPISKAGSIGTATYPFNRANINCGQWSVGDIKIHHSYNGLVPVAAGWFPCDGSVINGANYDAVFGAGAWAADIVSSSLDGKYSPDFTGKYPVGKAATAQTGVGAITAVGNASNQISTVHLHKWVNFNADATSMSSYQSDGATGLNLTSTTTKNSGAEGFPIAQNSASRNDTIYTNNAGSATQSIQPSSIEVIYYIKIV